MLRTNLGVYHDCRKYSVKYNGYPIKIRIHHMESIRYLKTGYYSDTKHYINSNHNSQEFLDSLRKQKLVFVSKQHTKAHIINEGMRLKLNAAEQFLFKNQKGLVDYSINELKRAVQIVVDTLDSDVSLISLKRKNTTLIEAFQRKISELASGEQWGTKRSYQDSLSAFMRYLNYRGKPDIPLVSVNKKWIINFDAWYRNQPGKEGNRMGLSSRNKKIIQLKHLIKLACDDEDEVMTWAGYTFHNYKLPREKTAKRSFELSKINLEEIAGKFDLNRVANVMDFLRQLKLIKNTAKWHYRNYALFMWDCRGMDLVDLAFLKRKSIYSKTLTYSRRKVVGNSPATIDLNEEAIEILEFYDYTTLESNQLVFPWMRKEYEKYQGMTENVYKLYQNRVRYFNKAITSMLQMIGLDKATSKMIRHTWAQDGFKLFENRDLIGEGLIHNNPATTKIYARELDRTRINEANLVITKRKSNIITMREDICIDLFQFFQKGKLWDIEVNECKSKIVPKLTSYKFKLTKVLGKEEYKEWLKEVLRLDELEFDSYESLEKWLKEHLQPKIEEYDIRLITSNYNI